MRWKWYRSLFIERVITLRNCIFFTLFYSTCIKTGGVTAPFIIVIKGCHISCFTNWPFFCQKTWPQNRSSAKSLSIPIFICISESNFYSSVGTKDHQIRIWSWAKPGWEAALIKSDLKEQIHRFSRSYLCLKKKEEKNHLD